METVLGIATLVSIIVSVVLAIQKKGKVSKLEQVATGLAVVENAINRNKTVSSQVTKLPGGKQVVNTIRDYGPAAIRAVDLARKLAREYKNRNNPGAR